MTTAHALDDALSPELEAIAAAAHDRLQAHAGQDLSAQEAAHDAWEAQWAQLLTARHVAIVCDCDQADR